MYNAIENPTPFEFENDDMQNSETSFNITSLIFILNCCRLKLSLSEFNI